MDSLEIWINSRTLLCKDYMIPPTIIKLYSEKILHDSMTGSLVALLPALDASGISQFDSSSGAWWVGYTPLLPVIV